MDPIGRIRSILSKYVSPITGEALIAAALRRLRPGARDLSPANLERILQALDRGIDLFVAEDRRAALRAELAALAPAAPAPLSLEIRDEADVERARQLAAGLCERLGARPSSTWKVVSGVVALANRLAARPSAGHIEVIPLPDPPSGVRVRAIDRDGPPTRPPAAPGQRPPASGPPHPSAGATPTPRPPPGLPAPSPRAPAGAATPTPRPPPGVTPASTPRPPPGAFDAAMPTIRRVADRFDVRGVGNRTHVEFDVWFSNVQRSQ